MADPLRILLPRLSVEEWRKAREEYLPIDVRSPREFAEDHLPGARSYPVLEDEERAEVGKLYRHDPHAARLLGARYITRNIARHLQDPFFELEKERPFLVYCWRGGMRSMAFGVVLHEIGYRVYLLQGGYRAYRRMVVQRLKENPYPYWFWILTGPTGSGKSALLRLLKALNPFPERWAVLDLEALACHRGSVFGELGEGRQPSQKGFESRLWLFFETLPPATSHIFLEDESRRIGKLEIPSPLWERIRGGKRILVTAPLQERVKRILREYPLPELEELPRYLERLRPFLGSERIAELHRLSREGAWEDWVALLLREHYDPLYLRHLKKHAPELLEAWVRSETAAAPLPCA